MATPIINGQLDLLNNQMSDLIDAVEHGGTATTLERVQVYVGDFAMMYCMLRMAE